MASYLQSRSNSCGNPLRVIRPEEVIYVSVLKATGLIEAELAPPLSPNGKYVPSRTAIVVCITDAGMAELKKLQDERQHQRRA